MNVHNFSKLHNISTQNISDNLLSYLQTTLRCFILKERGAAVDRRIGIHEYGDQDRCLPLTLTNIFNTVYMDYCTVSDDPLCRKKTE